MELARMGYPSATRARYCLLNGFRYRGFSYNLYDLSRTPRRDFLRLKNLGPVSLLAIGMALQNLGIVKNGAEWATIKGIENPSISLRSIDKKLDKILDILKEKGYGKV